MALCLSTVAIRAQDAPAQQSPSPDATTAAGQPKNVAAISGTVFSASTGQPLKKAHITLASQDDRGGTNRPISTLSDDAGHFSIDGIEPGRYGLFAERNGYIRQHYGQTKPGTPGALLTLSADQKITDLVFRLQQSGVITGRVVDEDGDPLPGAQVQAMRRSYFRGKTTFAPVGQSGTDDRGEYRIYGMQPGCILFNGDESSQLRKC
jgi:protocatechuate 3,4-dioxygenase beta subunit